MSSTKILVSSPTLFSHKSIEKQTPLDKSFISFTSNITKSRLSIKNPSGSLGIRPKTRIQASYAPTKDSYAPAKEETLYEVLGIAESVECTFTDIKKAYKQMARKYHPDVSPPDRVDEHTKRFVIVHQAYETLSNPQKRALYDNHLRFGFSANGTRQYDQGMAETGEWKMRWQSQLDELKRRNLNKEKMSWGARMRNQRL
ncbi:hypothetical protein ACJIZ3_017726 [Penstemon smallii]|uniref:J domain-containing protein n=1 Tax=Penstemon smallii TaxID=265156 RepID=A0ABD3SWD0_9LAMI